MLLNYIPYKNLICFCIAISYRNQNNKKNRLQFFRNKIIIKKFTNTKMCPLSDLAMEIKREVE